MTIEQFSKKNSVKVERVLKWVYEGLIPKASADNDYVPESARIPYKSKAKKAASIYESIVKASCKLKHVTANSYGLCEEEFNGYIERLVKAGCIEKRITDGVTYYDATIQAVNINRTFILNAIKAISQGVSEGATTALLNNVDA